MAPRRSLVYAREGPPNERHLMRLSLLVAALGSLLGVAQASALDLGDPAPKLSISQWIKGDAVSIGDGKTTVVIEFWATWCHPCKETMPHLSATQTRLKDKKVVVIGISDEDSATVSSYVAKQGTKLGYRIAIDGGAAAAAYSGTPGFFGIPFAVIVDPSGTVAWYGHPMAGMDEALSRMVEGRYDIAAVKRARGAAKLMPRYFSALVAGDASAAKLGEQILSDGAADPGLLNELAWRLLTDERLKTRDLDLAMRAARAAYDGSGGRDAAIIDTYARALFDTGDVAGAIKLEKQAIELCTSKRLLLELRETLTRYEAAAK